MSFFCKIPLPGMPTSAFGNEPLFGQNPIDMLIWRMESWGLPRRSRC
jgi:hypothetical protein